MSAYIIKINETKSCQVGWDPPLQTFYARVFKTDEEGDPLDEEDAAGNPEENNLLWVGCKMGEVQSVDRLQELLKDYARIPPRIRAELEAE